MKKHKKYARDEDLRDEGHADGHEEGLQEEGSDKEGPGEGHSEGHDDAAAERQAMLDELKLLARAQSIATE